jgi:ankyrin repeat protein
MPTNNPKLKNSFRRRPLKNINELYNEIDGWHDDIIKLLEAISDNDYDKTKQLIEEGTPIYARYKNQMTALHFAAKEKNYDILKLLIESGANTNAVDNNKETILHYFMDSHDPQIVSYLIRHGANINTQNIDKSTPLHLAAKNRAYNIVEILLENNAKQNLCDKNNTTPLHIAVREKCLVMAHMLIQHKANINAKDIEGHTPLHYAAISGHLDMLSFLILAGASLDARDIRGVTPLQLALKFKHNDIAKALVESGADVNSIDNQGKSVLDYCPLMDNRDMTSFLVKRGAKTKPIIPSELLRAEFYEDIAIEKPMDNFNNDYPLIIAAKEGRDYDAIFLIENGVDINGVDSNGITALLYYAQLNNIKMAQLLINRGAKLDVKDNCGLTALHYAACYGYDEMGKLLLENNANIDTQDNSGWTPLHSAIAYDNLSFADLLIRNGADLLIQTTRSNIQNIYQVGQIALENSSPEWVFKNYTISSLKECSIKGKFQLLRVIEHYVIRGEVDLLEVEPFIVNIINVCKSELESNIAQQKKVDLEYLEHLDKLLISVKNLLISENEEIAVNLCEIKLSMLQLLLNTNSEESFDSFDSVLHEELDDISSSKDLNSDLDRKLYEKMGEEFTEVAL